MKTELERFDGLRLAYEKIRCQQTCGDVSDDAVSGLARAVHDLRYSAKQVDTSARQQAETMCESLTDVLISLKRLESRNALLESALLAACLDSDGCEIQIDPKYMRWAQGDDWMLDIGGGKVRAVKLTHPE